MRRLTEHVFVDEGEDGTDSSEMSSPEAQFQARKQRFDDAVALRKPDRVPVVPVISTYYHTRVAGISNKDAMRDYSRAFAAARDAVVSADFDAAFQCAPMSSKCWEILGLTQLKWPGGVLRDDEPFQFTGGETLKASEYDEFLEDPNRFTVTKIWPQISTLLLPMGQIPIPSLYEFSNPYALSFGLAALVSAPPVMDVLKSLTALGQEFSRFQSAAMGYAQEMASLGYPISVGAFAQTAFDWTGDFLRGMRGVLMDMHRNPAKLLETIERLIPSTIQQGVMSAEIAGTSTVFIPLHWCADGFMSPEQYDRFYWPGLKSLLLGLLDVGLTPVPFFEGECTTRLERLKELPRGKVAAHFDIVDRRKAKEAIGDTVCFWGNVPAALLATGTPQQVNDDVRDLIEIFGDNGGLIVDATVGIPDEAKPENVMAMVEAAREYGVY